MTYKIEPDINYNNELEYCFYVDPYSAGSPNGLKCPECGAALRDVFYGIWLMSNPPQKQTHCLCCDYKGYRVV